MMKDTKGKTMIPKIIHYCWFGGKPLPAEVKKCVASWKKYCPDYEIIQWNENNFDIACHPFVKTAYEAKAWAFVSDYARLKIVYDHGGIYFDTDVELLKPPDALREFSCYFGVQQEGLLCATGLGFGAVKAHPMVGKMLAQYDGRVFRTEDKKKLACPYLNHRALAEKGYQYKDEVVQIDDVVVLPPRFLDPLPPGDGLKNLLCADTVSVHHYSATWMGGKTALRRKLIRFVGQERVSKLKRMIRHER